MTSNWSDAGQVPWLREHGIELVRGVGRLDGTRAVTVGPRRLTASRAVVLATGTRPALPPIPGLAEAQPWDNRDATAVKALPRRLIVLGGGAIGVEMAQAYRRLGCEEVTVIEVAPRLLAREEPFAGEEVRAALEAEGVRVVVGARVDRVDRDGTDGPVVVSLAGERLMGDELLVAAGRRVMTDELGLDTVGLAAGRLRRGG